MFGTDGELGVARMHDGSIGVVKVADVGLDAILTHNVHSEDPGVAFALSRLADTESLNHTAIGVFRDVHRASYDRLAHQQVAAARLRQPEPDLQALLNGRDTWEIE